MSDDDLTSRSGTEGDDTYAALVDRRDRAQGELDQSVTIMNADVYLITSRLPGMAASKDQALHDLAAALTALKAAERGRDDTQIERGQWGLIDAASALCRVTGGNVVELSELVVTGLGSYNAAVAGMATVQSIHDALIRTADDPPPTQNTNDGTAD